MTTSTNDTRRRRFGLAIAAIILLLAVVALLTVCSTRLPPTGSVHSFDWIDDPSGMALRGDTAWVVSNDLSAVTGVDISDSGNPRFRSIVKDEDTPANDLAYPVGIALDGDIAWITVLGSDALTAIDVSDPDAPRIVGSVRDEERMPAPRRVAVHDDVAWVADEDANGLISIDISDPGAPRILGLVRHGETMETPFDVVIHGDTAWVAAFNADRLVGVDISDPTEPEIVSSVSDRTLDAPSRVARDGTTVWVASWSGYLTGVDVSDPSDPVVTERIELGERAMAPNDLELQDGIAWIIGAAYPALKGVDISGDEKGYLGEIEGLSGAALELDGMVGWSTDISWVKSTIVRPEAAVKDKAE